MSKTRLKYDIIAKRAEETESGVNIDLALMRRKTEIQNISNTLSQTIAEVQEMDDIVTSAAEIAMSVDERLDEVEEVASETSAELLQLEDYVDDLDTELDNKLDKSESANYYPRHENPEGYLTESDLSEYAKQQWVEDQGYLKAADLDDYAKTADVNEEFVNTSAWANSKFQIQGEYVTSAGLDGVLDDYKTASEVEDDLADTSAWAKSVFASAAQLSDYATTQDLRDGLNDKLDKSESANYYPRTGNPSNFLVQADLNGYATETYVDTGLGNTSAWAKDTFASASQLDDYYPVTNPEGYITEDDLVQADWEEDDTTSKSYIQNKPVPLSLQGDSGVKITETENALVISVSADYATKGYVDDGLADKVDKVTGMGLSHEDFTSAYQDKLDHIEASAQVNVQSDWAEDDENSDAYIANKPVPLSMAAGEGISITEDNDTITFSVSADYATKTYVQSQTSGKVDKVAGMGLSHEDFTSAYKNKIDGIEAGANKNVQSDWTEDDETSDSFIQNKPAPLSLKGIDGIEITDDTDNIYVGVSGDFATNDDLNYVSAHIPSLAGYATENYVQQQTSGKVDKVTGKDLSTNDFTDALKDKLDDIEDEAQKNVQSDWEVVDTTSDAYIKNKPAPLSMAAGEGIRIVESDNTVTFSVSASYAAASALDYVSAGVDYVSGALNGYATTSDLQTGLEGKVDAVPGKGLSTNDYDDAASAKLYGIQAGAEVNVQSDWGQSDNTADDFIKNKPTPISMAAGNGISITEANDTVTFAVSADYATRTYVYQETSGKLDKSESANYWPQATANEVIPAGTDASNQLVNELGLAAAIASFGGFKKSTPDASGKPTETDQNTRTIYLTHVDSATGPDKYNEWIWDSAGNDYELIGDTTLDLNGYATETYVDQHTSGKIDWASSGRFYLSTNPDHFVTSGELATLSAKIESDIPSLNGYATEEWVGQQGYLTSVPSEYVTDTEMGTAIETATSGKMDKSTSAQFYPRSANPEHYVTSGELSTLSAKIEGDIPSIAGLAAESWVQANFASAAQISDMATQTWVGQQDFATNDDVDYVSAALAGYATTSDLNDKVDKVAGKGLSTNDYDDAASAKLFSIAPSAEVNVQSDWNVTNSALDSYIWNKPDIIVPLASTSFPAPKKLVVVASMPAAANIDPDTIYLVKENVS